MRIKGFFVKYRGNVYHTKSLLTAKTEAHKRKKGTHKTAYIFSGWADVENGRLIDYDLTFEDIV